MSIRRAASWAQPRQLSSGPRGARTGRGPAPDMAVRLLLQPLDHALAEAALAGTLHRDQHVPRRQVHVVGPHTAGARSDEGLATRDDGLGVPVHAPRLLADR